MALRHLGKNLVIAGALVAAGFLVAWLRFRPHLGSEARWTDGRDEYVVDASEGGVRYAVWEPPLPLAGEVNGAEAEGRPAVSPDGRLLVFASGARGLGAELYVADLVDGRARDPRPLAAVAGPGDDLAPAFGGGYLWFASDRPGGAGGLDLWRVPYADGVFGAPEWVGPGVNGPADDTDPGPSVDGRRVAFASNRGAQGGGPVRGRDFDLYLAGLGPGESWGVESLPALNGPGDEREPAFATDGRTLFLASDREGGLGGFDLYRSALGRDGWLAPVPLRGVNGAGDERGPAPSADGFTLLYSGSVGEARPDLWRARTLELFREPGRPVGWRELLLLTVLLLVALLAWLAKRWEKLDVLYKCLLVSLLVHLLAMLWFRDVHPERELYAVEPGGARVRLRLEGPSGDAARNAERAGDVRVARAEGERSAAVAGRADVQGPQLTGGERAEAARAEAAAPAPSAAPQALANAGPTERSERPAESLRTDLADAVEAFAPRAGTAPELAVDGAREGSLERAPAVADTQLPRGDEGRPAPALAEGGTLEGRPARAERSERGRPAEPVARSEGGPAADAAVRSLAVAADLAGPSPDPGGDLRRGEASPLALEGSGEAALERRTASGLPEAAAPGSGLAGVPLEFRDSAPAPGGPAVAAVPSAGPAAAPRRADDPGLERSTGGDPWAGAELDDRPAGTGDVPAAASAGAAPDLGLERSGAGAAEELPRLARDGALPERNDGDVAGPAALARPDLPGGTPLALGGLQRPSAGTGAPAPRRGADPSARRDLPDLEGLTTPGLPGPEPASPSSVAAEAGEGPVAVGPAPELTLERLAGPRPERSASPDGPAPGALVRGDAPALPSLDRPLRGDVPALELPTRDGTEPLPTRLAGDLDRTPYRSRTGPEKARAIDLHGGSEETEAAVAAGLAYLARIQDPGGFWGSADDRNEKYRHVAVGKTGLCLLAFLGAGHWPGSGTEHEAVATRAVDFLLAVQHGPTGHFGDTNAYSHAIATYALGEVHALTHDERLRPALRRGVDWILQHQDRREDPRLFGGWGYYYPDGLPRDRWPRVSVSVWQVMALESARLGGLEVPDQAFADARTFLRRSWDEERGAFRYSHDPSRLNGSYDVLPGSTPAALFGLSLLGDDVSGREYRGARRFVLDRRPEGYAWRGTDAFVERAAGNLYFWYYGTLATFRVGGSTWERWNEGMKATLLPSQGPDGSWEPISVYATDYAGDDAGDRSYTTALCVLSLEVYYRYFTPLLKVE